jgi:hypothetical protein
MGATIISITDATRRMQRLLDVDHNGTINRTKEHEWEASFEYRSVLDTSKLLAKMDKNNDGRVVAREVRAWVTSFDRDGKAGLNDAEVGAQTDAFVAGITERHLTDNEANYGPTIRDKAHSVFLTTDANFDNRLDIVNEMYSDAATMAPIDTNHDGFVRFGELVARYKSIDENRDGRLSALEEIHAAEREGAGDK